MQRTYQRNRFLHHFRAILLFFPIHSLLHLIPVSLSNDSTSLRNENAIWHIWLDSDGRDSKEILIGWKLEYEDRCHFISLEHPTNWSIWGKLLKSCYSTKHAHAIYDVDVWPLLKQIRQKNALSNNSSVGDKKNNNNSNNSWYEICKCKMKMLASFTKFASIINNKF